MTKLVKIKTHYKDNKGVEKEGYNLVILLENGCYIKVQPVFKEDYRMLKTLAEDYEQ